MARRWSRPRSLALVTGVVVLALSPVMAGAAPLTSANIFKPEGFFRFCAEAQVTSANISTTQMSTAGITVGGTIYDDETDFQFSKSSVDITNKRIMTSGLVEYRDEDRLLPETVRCKFRTAESLNKGAWPAGESNNSAGFEVDPHFGFGAVGNGLVTSAVDQACAVMNQSTIDAVWSSLSTAQQEASDYSPQDSTLTTVPDDVIPTSIGGPGWLEELPPLAINGATLQVRSRALTVPTTEVAAARVLGAHYCTLVAPTYLRDVLLGDAEVA